MGQFSWFTQDTNKRIVNGEKFRVIMCDNKGNEWVEECYEGYGVFGGKDYYELLAEMNGLEQDRDLGIELAFRNSPTGQNPDCLHPSITESGEYYGGKAPEPDPDQGFETYEYDDVWEDFGDDEW